MAAKFKNMDSLKGVYDVVAEAEAALGDKSRTIATSGMPNVLGAALGAGAGGAIGFAALYGLGVAGLSAAGITSGLAAAGGIVGGGMAAGVGVLAAPVAIFAVIGYGILARSKYKKLLHAKQQLYRNVIEKYNKIINELKNKSKLSQERIDYLQSLVILLSKAREDLHSDLKDVGAL